MAVSYDYEDYLSQVPGYKRKDQQTLQDRATAISNLAYDPQRAEQERQAQWNEMQQINRMQQLKANQAGVDESLAYNDAQAKKAAAVRAAGSGAIGSSGLSEYLNEQINAATAAQRLNVAANLAQGREAALNEYYTLDRQSQNKLAEIERLRGQSASTLYGELSAAEDEAENAWRANALNIALGIGQGQATAADLQARREMEAERIKTELYGMNLPYQSMTQYQKAMLDLETAKTMGSTGKAKTSSGGSSGTSSSSNKTPAIYQSAPVGLRTVAENAGVSVNWDSKTGNVSVGNKTYTPTQLASMGGYMHNDRWYLPSSSMNQIL